MDVSLTVDTGRTSGTRPMRRLRREGIIPGVVYGLGNDPVKVSVPWPELRKALNTEAGLNALISLEVDGDTQLSIVKDLQRHPVRRDVLHVDFQLIDRNKERTFDVPVVLTGRAEAVENEKGIVDQLAYTVALSSKPADVPTEIEVDISHLDIGTTVTVSELILPEGVTADMDPETAVAVGSVTRSTIILRSGGEIGEDGELIEPVEGEEGAEGEGGEAEASADADGDGGGGED